MTLPFLLLDTNVFSYVFRRDQRADPFSARIASGTACIAAQTVAELHLGARKRTWGKARYEELTRAINGLTILNADKETAELWAELALQAQGCGRPMTTADLWIIATAERWEIPLFTCDKDFSWYDAPQRAQRRRPLPMAPFASHGHATTSP